MDFDMTRILWLKSVCVCVCLDVYIQFQFKV